MAWQGNTSQPQDGSSEECQDEAAAANERISKVGNLLRQTPPHRLQLPHTKHHLI